MAYYVYLLECKNKDEKITYYCGYTSKSPSKRLQAHINNVKREDKKHYTGRQKFVRLVYYETYEDRKTALKRERGIKKRGGKYKLGLIDGMRNLKRKSKFSSSKFINQFYVNKTWQQHPLDQKRESLNTM